MLIHPCTGTHTILPYKVHILRYLCYIKSLKFINFNWKTQKQNILILFRDKLYQIKASSCCRRVGTGFSSISPNGWHFFFPLFVKQWIFFFTLARVPADYYLETTKKNYKFLYPSFMPTQFNSRPFFSLNAPTTN